MQKPPSYFWRAQLRSRGPTSNPSLIRNNSKNDNPLAENGPPDDEILPLASPVCRLSDKNVECIVQNTYFQKLAGVSIL